MRSTFTRMVASATATVWIRVPAGGEYPNLKCKNRSPNTTYASSAWRVYPDGSVGFFSRYDVTVSYGSNFTQIKLMLYSPGRTDANDAYYVNSSGYISGGYYSVYWDSGGINLLFHHRCDSYLNHSYF